MKKLINALTDNICLFFLIICISNVYSQKKSAQLLLNEVTKKVKTYKNITIDFKYTISTDKKQESNGNAIMQDNRYVLNLLGITKIFDGTRTYAINAEDEEITISKFDAKDKSAITPARMLTFFNTGFKSTFDVVKNIKGRKIQYIKLESNNPKDSKKDITLGIDMQTKHIYSVEEISKNGTRVTILINSFKTNQPLSKNQFIFVESKYPKYYINKLD